MKINELSQCLLILFGYNANSCVSLCNSVVAISHISGERRPIRDYNEKLLNVHITLHVGISIVLLRIAVTQTTVTKGCAKFYCVRLQTASRILHICFVTHDPNKICFSRASTRASSPQSAHFLCASRLRCDGRRRRHDSVQRP